MKTTSRILMTLVSLGVARAAMAEEEPALAEQQEPSRWHISAGARLAPGRIGGWAGRRRYRGFRTPARRARGYGRGSGGRGRASGRAVGVAGLQRPGRLALRSRYS